jgi:hypothetical protein
MPEPTIICPKCKNEIKLIEPWAALLIESTRRDYEHVFLCAVASNPKNRVNAPLDMG